MLYSDFVNRRLKRLLSVSLVGIFSFLTTTPAYSAPSWVPVSVASSPFQQTMADGNVVTVSFGPAAGFWGNTYAPARYQTDASGARTDSTVRFTFSTPVTRLKTHYAFAGPGDDLGYTTNLGAVDLTRTFASGGNVEASTGNFVAGQPEATFAAGGLLEGGPSSLDASGVLTLQFTTGITFLEVRGVPTAGTPGINLIGLELSIGSATVTFDANEGQGTMANQTASISSPLDANSFRRSGYSFTGWNTEADGSGTAYSDTATYAFAADDVLFAQWLADPSSDPGVNSLPSTGVSGNELGLVGLSVSLIIAGVLLRFVRRSFS